MSKRKIIAGDNRVIAKKLTEIDIEKWNLKEIDEPLTYGLVDGGKDIILFDSNRAIHLSSKVCIILKTDILGRVEEV